MKQLQRCFWHDHTALTCQDFNRITDVSGIVACEAETILGHRGLPVGLE